MGRWDSTHDWYNAGLGHRACRSCGVYQRRGLRPCRGDPATAARIVRWLRTEYAGNAHAREWADAIEKAEWTKVPT